ncbi:protein yippee-like 1 isoform X1 [Alligator sinensis]|uniref:Protein yippee-like n=1 Tax=Alligator sinensis TaxID=38654 RepID=A0A3Q0GFY3_ALLSI|nr:protein yippee-like 1 isoform X1 [Alligator sinensis]
MVKMTKSKTFQAYLPNCHRTYSCIHCRAHLANHDELISKSFQGSQGRAYLFNSVVNVGCGPAEERVLLTGLHAVADIYCENCKTTLGWKYDQDVSKLNFMADKLSMLLMCNGSGTSKKNWTLSVGLFPLLLVAYFLVQRCFRIFWKAAGATCSLLWQ